MTAVAKPMSKRSRRTGVRPDGRAETRVAPARNFYQQALSEAERLELPEAETVEGLDQEIAVLRVRLKRALQEHPEDLPLVAKGLDLLVKAVTARYRLSPKSSRELADQLDAVFQRLSQSFLPAPGGNHDA